MKKFDLNNIPLTGNAIDDRGVKVEYHVVHSDHVAQESLKQFYLNGTKTIKGKTAIIYKWYPDENLLEMLITINKGVHLFKRKYNPGDIFIKDVSRSDQAGQLFKIIDVFTFIEFYKQI